LHRLWRASGRCGSAAITEEKGIQCKGTALETLYCRSLWQVQKCEGWDEGPTNKGI
jgi:hypothetical protein